MHTYGIGIYCCLLCSLHNLRCSLYSFFFTTYPVARHGPALRCLFLSVCHLSFWELSHQYNVVFGWWIVMNGFRVPTSYLLFALLLNLRALVVSSLSWTCFVVALLACPAHFWPSILNPISWPLITWWSPRSFYPSSRFWSLLVSLALLHDLGVDFPPRITFLSMIVDDS